MTTTYQTSLEISVTSSSTTVNIETIVPNPPKATPVSRNVEIECADGTVKEQGAYSCTWTFFWFTVAERAALRAYLSGKSTTCWIRTFDETNNSYKYYQGVGVWPKAADVDYPPSPKNKTGQTVITFRSLIEYIP